VVAPIDCNVTGVGTVHVSGLIIGFGSFTDLCGFAQASHFCDEKANATIVSLEVLKGGLVQTQAPVGAGTYPITTGTPVFDINGNFVVAEGSIDVWGAACAPVSNPDATGGTIWISAVTATRAQGSLDVNFGTGNHISGAFDLPLCAYTPDICALINDNTCGGGAPACIP
jgi:hypothetical protein